MSQPLRQMVITITVFTDGTTKKTQASANGFYGEHLKRVFLGQTWDAHETDGNDNDAVLAEQIKDQLSDLVDTAVEQMDLMEPNLAPLPH